MSDGDGEKYQNQKRRRRSLNGQRRSRRSASGLRVVEGGQYARRDVVDLDLERWLDGEMHTVFVRMLDPSGNVPNQAIEDTRCHRQHSWRVHARRLREAVFAEVEEDVIDEIPFVWRRYIERCREMRKRLKPTENKGNRAA